MILVTGAAGYIGSSFVKSLSNKIGKESIRAIDNFEIGTINEIDGIKVENVDVTDERQIRNILQDVEIIVHFAAYSDIQMCEQSSKNAILNNLFSVKVLLEEGRKQQLKKFIFPSSFAVYEPGHKLIRENVPKSPYNYYGFLKHWAEELIISYAKQYLIEYVIFRQTNVVGKGFIEKNTVINAMCRSVKKDTSLTIFGDGKQMRNFIHLKDVIAYYERALYQNSGIYNLGGIETKSIKEIAEEVALAGNQILGENVEIKYKESNVNEKVKEDFVFDLTKLIDDFKYKPTIPVKDMIMELLS
ncbi:MAG: NAD-dependent epimerase/dehydratase family protein [Bacillota bacterium]